MAWLQDRNRPLALLFSLSLVGYGLLARWFPLLPHYSFLPQPDVRFFAPSLADGLLYAGLLLALFALLLWAARLVVVRRQGLALGTILLSGLILALPLLATFPINATDVYRYYISGRVAVVHQADPLTEPVSEFPDDPYLPLAGEWATATSPYGPLWELTAGAVTLIVGDDLLAALLLFKVLATICHLAIGGLLWLSLRGTPSGLRPALTLLWVWNPALLLTFSVNGHNDALMLLWLASGWLLLRRGRWPLGLLVMMLGPLTKLIGLLALPLAFIECWRQLPGLAARIRLVLLTVVGGLVLAWLAFLPFGPPLTLARRLVSESSTGGGFSPLAAFILAGRRLGFNPDVNLAVRGLLVLIALVALWLLWRTWRGRPAARSIADTFVAYIILAFRFRIWYAVWPFMWLVLEQGQQRVTGSNSRARLAAGLTFLLTSQLSVIVYGQIRTELLQGSLTAAHLIGVPFTFGLPLLVGWLYQRLSARRLLDHHRSQEEGVGRT
ncbi:MAG: glycosyltransferase family 87 protein [Candidatus Promineifilaceae bacterium]|nr:glycosyltransferase family 87 protein [Candidatus Promineifilaceae bacterium]